MAGISCPFSHFLSATNPTRFCGTNPIMNPKNRVFWPLTGFFFGMEKQDEPTGPAVVRAIDTRAGCSWHILRSV